jgi:hypothetical protein
MSKFNKQGYTAIYPKAGEVLDEPFVIQLQRYLEKHKKDKLTEDHIVRNNDGIAMAVYVKTSQLKKVIEKDEGLNGLLITSKVTLTDIIDGPSLRLASGPRRSARVPAAHYVQDTKENKNTFIEESVIHESELPDRIKKYGIVTGLSAMVAGVALVGGVLINRSTKLMDGVASDVVTATDIDTKTGRNDGLQKVIEARSGIKKKDGFADKENAKREEAADKSPPKR